MKNLEVSFFFPCGFVLKAWLKWAGTRVLILAFCTAQHEGEKNTLLLEMVYRFQMFVGVCVLC